MCDQLASGTGAAGIRLTRKAALLMALLSGWGLMSNASASDSVPGTQEKTIVQTCGTASLQNGFTIHFSRRESDGSTVRLYLCAESGSGYIEVPADQIDSLEEGKVVANDTPLAAPTPAAAAATNEPAPLKESIKNLIARMASRYQIDPDFVSSVVSAESGFNPMAISPKGAKGLMQLMPETAALFGVANVFDPTANVEAGTRYLRQLLDKYHGDPLKALAAYNAGPTRVEQFNGVPPYDETRAYIAKIIEEFNRKKVQEQAVPALPMPSR